MKGRQGPKPQGATDKELLTYFISLQPIYVEPERMHTEQGKAIARDIVSKFEGYKRWATNQINQLKK